MPWDIVFYKAADESVPTDDFLDACPVKVRAQLLAVLDGVEQVWTSPLARARATAALAFPSIEASLNAAFIEVDYGALEGRPITEVSSTQWRDFEGDHTMALGDGESLSAVDQRVHAQLDDLLGDPSSLLHQAQRHLAIVGNDLGDRGPGLGCVAPASG